MLYKMTRRTVMQGALLGLVGCTTTRRPFVAPSGFYVPENADYTIVDSALETAVGTIASAI